MTTTLYLVRHAEAEGNWKRTFQGHIDSKVSEKGWMQLDYLARRFEQVHLDAVYSSPLKRAWATAEAMNRFAGLPITPERGLMEIDGGAFEGLPFAELPTRYPEENAQWDNTPWLFQAPGGESMRHVFERMQTAIDAIVRANPGRVIAAASHGCAIRNYLCYALGWPLERIADVCWCDNTAVSLIEFDDSFRPHIVYLSDASHLPEHASTFATQSWWRREEQHAASAAQ